MINEIQNRNIGTRHQCKTAAQRDMSYNELHEIVSKSKYHLRKMGNKKELSPKQREELISALKARFGKNINRHKSLDWAKLQAKLEQPAGGEKLWSLNEMERTGGEPDVVGLDKDTGEYIFYDCSA
jgi:hypothetical protein